MSHSKSLSVADWSSYLARGVQAVVKKVPFQGKMLILGCGAICSCALPILLDLVDIDPNKITVLEIHDEKRRLIQSSIDKGVKFAVTEITPENRASVLSSYLSPGDFLFDLAWEIDTMEQLQWCRDNDVLFLNTSLEVWNPVGDAINNNPHPRDRTLYQRHQELEGMVADWGDNAGPTSLYEHGANPGMVSYLAKKALEDLTAKLLTDANVVESRKVDLKAALDKLDHAKLCYLTGTKVIHISERDTQITKEPKRPGEFLNTWSIEGYYEEGIAPVELCWGTHEKHLPKGHHFHPVPENHKGVFGLTDKDKVGHCICLSQPGIRTWSRSYVPEDGGNMIGMLMPHGEAITIGHHFTLRDEEGNVLNRPTVYFVYCPSDEACASIQEVVALGVHKGLHDFSCRLMLDDIVSGKDKLGVLLLGHDYKAWWTGSLLSIEESRRLVPGQNATSMQVAAGAVAGVVWAIQNPRRGAKTADDIPWQEVLPVIMPYLGEFRSEAVDWDPLSTRVDLYKGWNSDVVDESDPWQFCNFQIPGCPSCSF